MKTGGDGTATVQTGIVKSGTYAARFTESTGRNSFAYARATLPADQNELTVNGDVQFATEGSSGTVPSLRLFDAGGTRRFSLDRQNGSGALSFTDGAGTVALGGSLPVATWGHVDVHLVSGAGTALIEIQLNGSLIYSNQARTLSAMRTLQIGNDTKKQILNAYVDNVTISAPGGGPTAPNTTITSGPSGTVNATTATFAFTSTVGGSTFGCSLDGGAATGCSSPASYTGLPEGWHTFTVAATANGLTDPTPASQTWGIDLTPTRRLSGRSRPSGRSRSATRRQPSRWERTSTISVRRPLEIGTPRRWPSSPGDARHRLGRDRPPLSREHLVQVVVRAAGAVREVAVGVDGQGPVGVELVVLVPFHERQ